MRVPGRRRSWVVGRLMHEREGPRDGVGTRAHLELLRVLDDGHELLNLVLGELTGAAKAACCGAVSDGRSDGAQAVGHRSQSGGCARRGGAWVGGVGCASWAALRASALRAAIGDAIAGGQRRVVPVHAPLVRVNLSLLADEVGEAAADTADGGQREHYLGVVKRRWVSSGVAAAAAATAAAAARVCVGRSRSSPPSSLD